MRRHTPIRDPARLKQRLDELVSTFDVGHLTPDPLELVLRYSDPLDQEVAGLIAAAFAYGRADIIVSNIGGMLDRMSPSPFAYLSGSQSPGGRFDPREASRRFAGFSHRFHKTPELVALLRCIASAIERYGSLGGLFRISYLAEDEDIGPSLARFVASLIDGYSPAAPRQKTLRPALQYLLSSPVDGSACKRMNLYLRWMVRRTPPDLGLWSFVDPARLVIPLDTHIHRISTFLGLNRRRSGDWKTARMLTAALARLDPKDPTRYDFALCRLGILNHCSRKRRKENCDRCLLLDVCRFPLR